MALVAATTTTKTTRGTTIIARRFPSNQHGVNSSLRWLARLQPGMEIVHSNKTRYSNGPCVFNGRPHSLGQCWVCGRNLVCLLTFATKRWQQITHSKYFSELHVVGYWSEIFLDLRCASNWHYLAWKENKEVAREGVRTERIGDEFEIYHFRDWLWIVHGIFKINDTQGITVIVSS